MQEFSVIKVISEIENPWQRASATRNIVIASDAIKAGNLIDEACVEEG